MITRELAAQIRNTAAFIAANPTKVVLVPRSRERTPAGGYRMVDGAPRPPQTFRLIEQSAAGVVPVVPTANGTERRVDWVVLGLPDAQMARDDYWVDPVTRREWEILDMVVSNGYEVRGLAVERGK